MSYIHVDILQKQSSKVLGEPCGDVIGYDRNDISTTLVLSDGLGSGIKANIAANMCVSRALELLKSGASLKETFTSLVSTMNNAWGTDNPFAVFSIARILRNGDTTVLSYEMPPPLLVNSFSGNILMTNATTIEKAITFESHCSLNTGEGIMLVSDGITQAGLGCGLRNGWEIEGVSSFITDHLLNQKADIKEIPELVHNYARTLWRKAKGDDCSIVFAHCRNGITVNLITGPPENKDQDEEFVNNFLSSDGIKIVCGGTTAKLVSRIMKRPLGIKEGSGNSITPPEYLIDGINFVTEGAVTLNQAYNILDEDLSSYDAKSGVFALVDFLNIADKINFWIGDSSNEGIENIAFKQQHILSRDKITRLIMDNLRTKGKLVIEIKPNDFIKSS